MAILVRKAGIADVAPIHKLINGHAENGVMLPRSLHSLYEHLRDYAVAVEGDQVVGVIGLHISWSDLAEIRSMAVATTHQGRGLGRRLVAEAIDEAVRLGISKVFVLTFVPDFLMGDDPEAVKQGLFAAFERLLELDFDTLLLAHGAPLVGRGREELAAFVSAHGGARGS